MNPAIYDTHVHLADPYYADDMAHTLRYMQTTGTAACCVSTNLEDSAATLRLNHDMVLPFIGIHPQFAGQDHVRIGEMAESHYICGIGEIGLDPTYGNDGQRAAFEYQLGLAERLDLPVSIHSRKSLDAVLDTLTSYRCNAALHWFDGNKSRLRRACDMGLYISYGPLAVYAADKQRLASLTDQDRILIETDGPVRFAGCFGHTPAHPGFLPSIVYALAKALGLGYNLTLETLHSNTQEYLNAGRRYN